MTRNPWRRRLARRSLDPRLLSWLTEAGSLTARCQQSCGQFRVRLLRSGMAQPCADEARRGKLCRVREVLLECDGVPVIFAHSVMSTATHGRLSRWLAGLGSRSLGSLLFSYPGFRRGALEFVRLDARHPLYRHAAPWAGGTAQLWARRSTHRLGRQSLTVTEVFLPGLLLRDRDSFCR